MTRFRLEAALLGTVLIWGANFSIFKVALRHMHPHAANALRFVVAIIVLLVAYRLLSQGSLQALWKLTRQHGLRLIGLSLLGYGLYQLCFVVGISRTSAGSAALIMASAPLWTALTAWLSGVEQLGRMAWVGLLVSLVGTMLVVLSSTHAAVQVDTLPGNLLMLAAAVLWGMYTTFSKPLLKHMEPTALVCIESLMAYPFLLLLGLPYLATTAWGTVTAIDILALVYSGALSVGLTIVAWNSAVREVGPAATAVYSNLVPFVAALFGLLLLREPITVWQVIGGGIIISGLVTMRRARRVVVPPAI